MAQAIDRDQAPKTIDPYDIGWWIESADEETYGPVSRKTLRRFLEEGDISPNTLVRHCTQDESLPVADQPGMMDRGEQKAVALAAGDRLAEVWPRKKHALAALGEDAVPCARHRRPATLVCVRCHAPYCSKCRAKPFRRRFYFCRRCQASNYNRRAFAYLLDGALINGVPYVVAVLVTAGSAAGIVVVSLVQVVTTALFLVRDALWGGAGPGKRLMGLRAVQIADGKTPLTYGQAFLRWISLLIPFFNLFDLSVPFRDPLQRRYGDRWAGTRVIDTERKLAQARAKVRRWLARKGYQLVPEAVTESTPTALLAE